MFQGKNFRANHLLLAREVFAVLGDNWHEGKFGITEKLAGKVMEETGIRVSSQ